MSACRPEDALKLGVQVEQRATGGCLSAQAPVAISCWRTKNTINILVSKEDCAILADRLTQLKGGTEAEAEAGNGAAAEATPAEEVKEAKEEALVE
jgi:hypothetical protein